MYIHNHHLTFLESSKNIAQLYRDDRKKNIFCTSAETLISKYQALWTWTLSFKVLRSIYLGPVLWGLTNCPVRTQQIEFCLQTVWHKMCLTDDAFAWASSSIMAGSSHFTSQNQPFVHETSPSFTKIPQIHNNPPTKDWVWSI